VSEDKEEFMRKYAPMAALAGTIFATAVAFNRADASTLGVLSGVADADATVDAQPDLVRWCGWRGCPDRYRYYDYRPRTYHYYGYYRPLPYDWGYWPRCLQTALGPC
jgi:hypothetical protein